MAKAVRFDLIADASKFTRGMRDAQKSSEKFTDHTSNAGKALKAAVGAFSVGVVVDQMRNWVAAARDSNKTAAQTATVLKSTHGAAGLTADQFAKLATEISKTAAIDDDLVQSGENIIATFTQIHGDVFKKTTKAAVDMTAAMNHGEVTQEALKGSAVLLGKALNDPLKGLSALTRVGVTFSEQQRKQIADFVKHGQVAKAQGVILAEVNKEFGGSAAAAVTPAKQLAVTWGNMQEVLGNLLIPAIDRGAKILNSFLEVADRNRTTFGVLLGVLGAGAAIIGTLVVAEKIHAAVTEGIQAVTKAWSVAQKGLNVVLGTTRVQALSTAAAENTLAVSTTAAGTATKEAAIAGTGLAAGLGRLIPIVGLAAIGFKQYQDTTREVADLSKKARQQAELGIGPHRQLGLTVAQAAEAWRKEEAATKTATKATGDNALQTAFAKKQAEAQRLEMVKAIPQFQTQADKVALNAEKAKELSTKLSALKDQWKQQTSAVKDTILSYDGLISQSKVTAGQVVRDLHNQVSNFKTYSADVKKLIKAGVSPAAIQELSQKGPQYVHALATGTGTELARYKKFWKDRQSEVKSSFATSMQLQFEDLVRKMKAMQREINKLKGKTVQVTARTSVEVSKSVRMYLAAANVPGFHAKGARIPGYGGGDIYPAMLEPGEAVVPKEKARRPEFKQWAGAMKIPGYRAGGLIGDFYNPTVRQTGRVGQSMADVAAAVLRQAAALPGYGGGAGSALAMKVAQWTISALRRPLGEIASWYRRLIFESGGNPRAINKIDSNWRAGHPSVGIAQVIRGTFAANAGRFRGVGPFAYGVSMHPYANSYAGAHYAVGRYGSLAAVDPRMRHMGYDRGGWLHPGMTMAYNGTGRSEPVGLDEDRLAAAIVRALAGLDVRVAVDDIHQGLLGKKNRNGGMRLGLT